MNNKGKNSFDFDSLTKKDIEFFKKQNPTYKNKSEDVVKFAMSINYIFNKNNVYDKNSISVLANDNDNIGAVEKFNKEVNNFKNKYKDSYFYIDIEGFDDVWSSLVQKSEEIFEKLNKINQVSQNKIEDEIDKIVDVLCSMLNEIINISNKDQFNDFYSKYEELSSEWTKVTDQMENINKKTELNHDFQVDFLEEGQVDPLLSDDDSFDKRNSVIDRFVGRVDPAWEKGLSAEHKEVYRCMQHIAICIGDISEILNTIKTHVVDTIDDSGEINEDAVRQKLDNANIKFNVALEREILEAIGRNDGILKVSNDVEGAYEDDSAKGSREFLKKDFESFFSMLTKITKSGNLSKENYDKIEKTIYDLKDIFENYDGRCVSAKPETVTRATQNKMELYDKLRELHDLCQTINEPDLCYEVENINHECKRSVLPIEKGAGQLFATKQAAKQLMEKYELTEAEVKVIMNNAKNQGTGIGVEVAKFLQNKKNEENK
jgi:hypothetical protein